MRDGYDDAKPLVWAFPEPEHAQLAQAFLNLQVAANGTDDQKRALGDPRNLPRPWDPASLTSAELRYATWRWLNDFVLWFNHEQAWNPNSLIPACWPQHPHLVHQIAVLADQRRQAGEAFTSQPLEEWHRYAVPAFLDRMRQQLSTGCDKTHAEWPNSAKYRRLLDTERDHVQSFNDDIDLLADDEPIAVQPAVEMDGDQPGNDEDTAHDATGLALAIDAAARIAAGLTIDDPDPADQDTDSDPDRRRHGMHAVRIDPTTGERL